MKSPELYLGNLFNLYIMYFTPTGPREIKNIIKSFKTKICMGDVGMSMYLLEQLCEPCSEPFAIIVNLSRNRG